MNLIQGILKQEKRTNGGERDREKMRWRQDKGMEGAIQSAVMWSHLHASLSRIWSSGYWDERDRESKLRGGG